MSLHNVWTSFYPSTCQLVLRKGSGDIISSGTGFMTEKGILTNHHVISIPFSTMEIRFVEANAISVSKRSVVDREQFSNALVFGSSENEWDYCFIRDVSNHFSNIPRIPLGSVSEAAIGDEVALLGYHFGHPNLTMHHGYISSIYTKAPVHGFQIDCSVNNGCSGGPLIRLADKKVIGLVTRKGTGLDESIMKVYQAMDANDQQLNAIRQQGNVVLMGLDPAVAFQAAQAQIRVAMQSLERSANVGIGYAYRLDEICRHLNMM